MIRYWHFVIAEVGSLEQAVWIVLYAAVVCSLVLGILLHWAVLGVRRMVRHYRVGRMLRQVRFEAYQERARAIGRIL